MRAWIRVRRPNMRCGQCGMVVPIGAPILQLSIDGSGWMKYRCAGRCADALPPEDLPPLVVPPPPPVVPLIGRSLPFDWKSAAVAEREPGEDA